jgi:hypothetical protein
MTEGFKKQEWRDTLGQWAAMIAVWGPFLQQMWYLAQQLKREVGGSVGDPL